MKKITFLMFVFLLFGAALNAQTPASSAAASTTAAPDEVKPKRKVFRANKEQILQAQKMLKVAETGKMDVETRDAVKTFQGENGLRKSGALNRATLEKMNIALTDAQKEIPVAANSFAAAADGSGETKKRGPVFRATKDQIIEAQKLLKEKGVYAGEQTGKLDDATREGLKKFQQSSGAKVTGTLNRETLEKLGIALTDKQKEI